MKRRQIWRRFHLAAGGVEQQRRKCRNPGEASAVYLIESIGHCCDFGRRKPAFVTTIEFVAFAANARKQRLDPVTLVRGDARLVRFLKIEHRPVVGFESSGCVCFMLRNLREMADMTN